MKYFYRRGYEYKVKKVQVSFWLYLLFAFGAGIDLSQSIVKKDFVDLIDDKGKITRVYPK